MPALQLGQLFLCEVGWRRMAFDIGGDQVGEPILIRRRERGTGLIEDQVEEGANS